MNANNIYEDTISEQDLDHAVLTLRRVSKETLKLTPNQEVAIFLITLLSASFDAQVNVFAMMRQLVNLDLDKIRMGDGSEVEQRLNEMLEKRKRRMQ